MLSGPNKMSPLSFSEEKTDIAVTLARNKSRSLEVIEKRLGKNMGSRRDIFFTLQG